MSKSKQYTYTELDRMAGVELSQAVHDMTRSRRSAVYHHYYRNKLNAELAVPPSLRDVPISKLRTYNTKWGRRLDHACDRLYWFGVGSERRLGPDWHSTVY